MSRILRSALGAKPTLEESLAMGNQTVRLHPPGALVGTVVLVVISFLAGVWLSGAYDALRVSLLDNALANQVGYMGEITDGTQDPLPHGINRAGMVVIFVVALVGWPIGYGWTVVARRRRDDPNAIEFALGVALVGAAAGFVWLSTDWTRPEPDNWSVVEQLVRYGNVWAPLIMIGIAALLLLAWWVHPGELQDDPAALGSS